MAAIFSTMILGVLTTSAQSYTKNSLVDNISNESNKNPGTGFAMELGLGCPDTDGHTYEVSFSVPYYFKSQGEGVYASAGLGYSSSFGNSATIIDGSLYSTDYNISLIAIPVKVGYTIGERKFGLTPYVGFNLGLTVTGKNKIKYGGQEEKMKIKCGKFAPDFRFGVYLRLWEFNLGGHYIIPISDDSNAVYGSEGYFEASIGFGF